nr:hypothetical protein [Tanacetum cinerariifolium]
GFDGLLPVASEEEEAKRIVGDEELFSNMVDTSVEYMNDDYLNKSILHTVSKGIECRFRHEIKTDTPNVIERERTPRVVVMIFKFQFNRDLVRDDKGYEFISKGDAIVDSFKRCYTSDAFDVGYRVSILHRSLINNSASLSNKFRGFYFILKFDISSLLHHVVTAIADRIGGWVMSRLDLKICAYEKNFSCIWTYTTMMLSRVRNHHGGKCVLRLQCQLPGEPNFERIKVIEPTVEKKQEEDV